MKYLMKFEDLFNYKNIDDSDKTFTVYRGTDYDGDPYTNNTIFFSTSQDFAEDYGKNIYKAEIKPKKIFDSFNPEHWKLLFQWCGRNGVEDPYNDTTYYSFEEMDEKNPGWENDTWEIIEACMWAIPGKYDCLLITEGGEVNFAVLDPDIIVESELLTERLNEGRVRNTANKIVDYIVSSMSKEKIKSSLQDFSKKLNTEGGEYKQVADIIQTYYATGIITKEQGNLLKRKLADSFKLSLLAGVWLIPGGAIWSIAIIKLAKRFGIQLLPNNLEKNKKSDEISE